MFFKYDIIVVGGGHAGCEAAAAAAQMGSKVLLITMSINNIGRMSCNPAMGGIAKGQLVREIDALGGYSAIIADKSMIQFRMLNKSKGPAMWSPRTQNDRNQFAAFWQGALQAIPNISFFQDMVTEIVVKDRRVVGVKTNTGFEMLCQALILTNGTFLNGIIHVGAKQFSGGRSEEKAAIGLTEQLISLGFESSRMKTGTPPRVDGRTLDYAKMEEQFGDACPSTFSFLDITQPLKKQKSCYITHTNPKVHAIIKDNIADSPMFNGTIQVRGPRYCPSIEEKIYRFADKERHQIFLEPEGWDTIQVYVNGFSTSLPENVQYKILQSISGFEQAKMISPGYAIEYDYFPPTQLQSTLETKLIENLYFAGQINGTTGYEEAACQGLLAGINAHRKINDLEPLILSRSDAYIGVLINDLVTKGTDEPYRMFTSRAEFRILLRQDNADLRLTEIGYKIGLADQKRFDSMCAKKKNIETFLHKMKNWKIYPEQINGKGIAQNDPLLKEVQSAYQLLKRPTITMDILLQLNEAAYYLQDHTQDVLEQVAIQIKYESYFQKEKELVAKAKKLESYGIPSHFDYNGIKGISTEGLEKLKKIKPTTIGQATHISGVSPADIAILMVYLKR